MSSRTIEIERKFDVDPGTPVPDWSTIPGVASVSAGEERHLDATYLDTPSADLARAGYALRRRTGGPDAGWHIKGPLVDGGRVELHWPLADGVPPEALAELATLTDGSDLAPLARIVNDRVAYELRDADGGVLAEFVDDRVETTDERSGTRRAWCEWEIELGPAAPGDRDAFFAEVERVALAAGATAPSSASKLARALGA
ncbi:CYTH domain-containing protein [Microbacterium excoecariae]|uniref:CYTH domain-containing protein n=1 Tax=Microbacterium excoecariae TaxID=2715210 RepID=UPI00140BAEC5|nr:CYTH domain-containing protein [Microbacterium excoecariae]